MERDIWTRENTVKALPFIAPLANTPPVISAINNGRYIDAIVGTAIGVGIGVIARIGIMRSLNHEKDAPDTDGTPLYEGTESLINLGSSQYEEPEL